LKRYWDANEGFDEIPAARVAWNTAVNPIIFPGVMQAMMSFWNFVTP
jgi:hypothetical protein